MVKIAVTFELGAECLLTITARELNTGRQVQAVMSTKEGAAAARRLLERLDGDRVQTASFAAPAAASPAAGAPPPSEPGSAPAGPGGVGAFLRRLFR
jgi:molecular chaperone DnaK